VAPERITPKSLPGKVSEATISRSALMSVGTSFGGSRCTSRSVRFRARQPPLLDGCPKRDRCFRPESGRAHGCARRCRNVRKAGANLAVVVVIGVSANDWPELPGYGPNRAESQPGRTNTKSVGTPVRTAIPPARSHDSAEASHARGRRFETRRAHRGGQFHRGRQFVQTPRRS
jgi:hypothetical protein